MQLVVTIFNSAGEVVRHLFTGNSQNLTSGFTTSTTGLVSGGAGVTLNFGGEIQGNGTSLTWNGTNDNGQPVSGGTYTIQVQTTDPFGATQSWTKSVTVMPQANSQSLNIYNSAGELVATMNTASFSSSPITNVGFGGSGKAAFVVGSGGGVQFVMQNSSTTPVVQSWNGKSNNGQIVSPGSYIVQLVDNSNGHVVMVSKEFIILAGPTQAFDVIAGPNPIGPTDKTLVFSVTGMLPGQNASVKLYNVAGELISKGVGAVGNSKIVFKVGNWSAGIYVAVVESCDGPTIIFRKLFRVAVER
jgi:hypothetical protein